MSFIVSLVALEIMGLFFVLVLMKRTRYDYSTTELFSLAFFLGAGLTVCLLFVYSLLGVSQNLVTISAIPVILFILLFSRYASRPERLREFISSSVSQRWSLVERLLFAGILVQILWTVFLVLPVPVNSHDAVANYALKAKIFYFSGGIPAGFFGFSEATVAHADYPLFLSFVLTWIYIFTGFNDLAVNMVMPVLYLSFLALFFSQVKRLFSRSYALLAVFLLATIPQLADYATIVYADLILAALVTCSMGYFVIYVREKNSVCLVFSAVLMGFSLWVKNEAIVFAGAYAAALFFFFIFSERPNKTKALKNVIIAFAILAVIAAPWFAVKATSVVGNSDIDMSQLTPSRLLQNVKDIPVLLNLLQQEIFGPKKWNIFWVILLAAMIWKRRILWTGERFYIMLFFVLSLAGYFAGYMVTTGQNLYFYVNTTISRFMLHFCGISMLLVAYLLWDEVRKIDSFTQRKDR